MKMYRVSSPASTHYGQIGTLLDKAEARRRYGGRTNAWYASWDVLIDFSCGKDPLAVGTGFMWSEVARVD